MERHLKASNRVILRLDVRDAGKRWFKFSVIGFTRAL